MSKVASVVQVQTADGKMVKRYMDNKGRLLKEVELTAGNVDESFFEEGLEIPEDAESREENHEEPAEKVAGAGPGEPEVPSEENQGKAPGEIVPESGAEVFPSEPIKEEVQIERKPVEEEPMAEATAGEKIEFAKKLAGENPELGVMQIGAKIKEKFGSGMFIPDLAKALGRGKAKGGKKTGRPKGKRGPGRPPGSGKKPGKPAKAGRPPGAGRKPAAAPSSGTVYLIRVKQGRGWSYSEFGSKEEAQALLFSMDNADGYEVFERKSVEVKKTVEGW